MNMIITKGKSVRRPRILVTSQDVEVIEGLIGHPSWASGACKLLEEELLRAVFVNPAFASKAFCRIGSWVTYEDLTSRQVRNIKLVLPADADIDKRQVSILSFVGAALLGLVADTEFAWADDTGRPHRLKVLHVGQEPHAQLE
ncbi:MAG: GreA/GreB family elongation factor [Pseudorhizobium sp.]